MYNFGDPVMSGILGLPYSDTADSRDSSGNIKPYQVLTDYLYAAEPNLPQYFSLAVSRAASGASYGGTFTLGGLPYFNDPKVNVTTATPTIVKVADVGASYVSWGINIDGWQVGSDSWATLSDEGTNLIVDSGNMGISVPTTMKKSLGGLWSSAPGEGGVLDCDATFGGTFGVKIGGVLFNILPEDLVVRGPTGKCWNAFSEAGGVSALGLPFLRNLLAVFDHGESQLA